MDANFSIDATLLDNRAEFDNAFFRRFTLRTASEPLQLTGTIAKDYLFPTLYGDVTCAIAIFLCPYARAEAMMPHDRIKPVKVTRGRAAVIFSCYEYRKVLGVAPYNEIAMTIPVMVGGGGPPVLPLIASGLFKRFGYYVFSMPVTSKENEIRGHKIWGLPKITQSIDISKEGGDSVTVAREADGTPYFTLRVPMAGKATKFDVCSCLYTRLGNQLLQSQTCFQGNFNVTKFMPLLWKKDAKPSRTFLELGDTPSGRILREMELEAHPFQFRYAEGMSSCFDLNNPSYETDIRFT
jgi:hypothetical protein